ncbi:hypothetical protein A2U01_0091774, partial [Trifolium medium]|nr:hypothetical protein [Trifolium medium]
MIAASATNAFPFSIIPPNYLCRHPGN